MTPTANLASYFVDRNLEQGGDRVALIHDAGRTTYAELASLVNQAGNAMTALGVTRGRRVLLALSDGVEFVATWYGAQKIGAVTAEAYTFLTPKDYAYFIEYTDAAVVVVDTVTLDPVREALATANLSPELLVVGVTAEQLRPGEHSFGEALDAASTELAPAQVAADDIAIWKFTTGSTGAPKACVHRAASALASHEAYARGVLAIDAGDVVLAVPKLFFGYARDLVALFPFGVGGTGIAFADRTTPELIFELIERHRPTILVNVPTMMSAMLAHPLAASADLSSLRLCTSAGEALPVDLHRRWDDTFGVEVVDGIGSSEAYHIYLSNRPGEPHHGTVGTPVPGYAARVLDDDGVEVPDGEVGTLEVTGPTIAVEYFGDAEKSSLTFDGDTLRTGDLFSRDSDGYFHHHGRADDLLKVGGIWVAPGEIEHCLVGHPDVLECGVVGHVREGLVRPRAYVVLRDDATTTTEALGEYARERLSGHKRPREVYEVDHLPRTSNGKLDRRALEQIDAGDAVTGRLVVVTGAAGGLGAAIVARFEAAGDRVVAAGHDECDVTSESSVAAFFDAAGDVDVLVNNAGISASSPLGRTTIDEWRSQLDVNATGAFLCTRAVLPGMRRRNEGRIVTVASTAGLAGAAYVAAYAASKHAAVGLMRSVAMEVAGTGVTANAVCPTFVRTPMTERSIERITVTTGRSAGEAEAALASTSPLGRLLEPDEVAFAIQFLAAPEAAAINGQALVLDGGGLHA